MANCRFRRDVRAEPETEVETAHPARFALGESASGGGGGAVAASAEASLLTLAGVGGGGAQMRSGAAIRRAAVNKSRGTEKNRVDAYV